jgi:Flp pilus assembly protein CpaB
LWFAGGLLLAGIAGVLAFVTLLQAANARQAVPEAPTVQVLVAARDLPLHTVLAEGDVTRREVAPEMVPEDALTDPEEAVGQMVVVDIARDEVILRRRLLEPDYLGPNVALVMDPERVVIAFPIFDLLSTLDILRPGDRVDMVFTVVPSTMGPELSEAKTTLTVMSDVVVAAVVRGADGQQDGAPRALLLAFEPQDALTVKYFQDIGAGVDLLLRSPAAAEGPFETVPVDADYVLQRFRLKGR